MRTWIVALGLLVARAANAQLPWPLDTFETDQSRDWFGAAPTYVEDGGPQGAGDAWLRLQSDGSAFSGGKMAGFCSATRWTGDYLASRLLAVSCQLQNPSDKVLDMRVVVFSGAGQRWTSKTAFRLQPFQGWTKVTFRIREADLVRVLGTFNYTQLMTTVSQVMLRHDPEPPSSGGVSIAAVLGVDNVAGLHYPVPPVFFAD
jgi:hypothetical protein